MADAAIRTWDRLYNILGYPGTNDPEMACAVIITAFTAPHQNSFIAMAEYYDNIRLHYHLSAVPMPHFAEVKQRLATILHPEATAFIFVEVLQCENRRIGFGTLRHPSPAIQNELEH